MLYPIELQAQIICQIRLQLLFRIPVPAIARRSRQQSWRGGRGLATFHVAEATGASYSDHQICSLPMITDPPQYRRLKNIQVLLHFKGLVKRFLGKIGTDAILMSETLPAFLHIIFSQKLVTAKAKAFHGFIRIFTISVTKCGHLFHGCVPAVIQLLQQKRTQLNF